MKRMNKQKCLSLLVTALALVGGGVCAVLRLHLMGEGYDPQTSFYGKGAASLWFTGAVLVFTLLLWLSGLLFLRTPLRAARGTPVQKVGGTVLGAGFLFFLIRFIPSFSRTGKTGGFLGVLICIFSIVALVASLYDWVPNCTATGGIRSVLSLFAPLDFLLIVFYFYFDGTTMVHSDSKKLAILCFVAFIAASLSDIRFDLRIAKPALFIGCASFAVFCSVFYAVPNVIYTFRNGTPVFLDIAYDVLILSLGVRYVLSLVTMRKGRVNRSSDR